MQKQGDFFGLFGCSPSATSSRNVPEDNEKPEEGEIIEKTSTTTSAINPSNPSSSSSNSASTASKSQSKQTENVQNNANVVNAELNSEDFGKLMEKYQKQLETRSDLASAKVCKICFQDKPKYTCPKCGLKTCSLKCCQFHKQHFSCDGVRDKLSFVPLTSYSSNTLQSDCKFLEQVRESLSDSIRDNKSRMKRKINMDKRPEMGGNNKRPQFRRNNA